MKRHVLINYKLGAAKRNLDFNLTDEQFYELVRKPCHYCGAPPQERKFGAANGGYKANGVDRIDNQQGYHLGNVVPCCKNCNMAKRTRTYDEFINWILQAAKHLQSRSA
jgi:hypothetical protein